MNKAFRSLTLAVQRALAGQDRQARGPARDFQSDARTPIFIVGAPRTGSTLLFQLLVRHFRVAYISNLMAAMPLVMIRAAHVTSRWMREPREIRESDLGYTPGLLSPNEGGAVMGAWFGRELGPAERRLVRNTVVMLGEILGGALVTKNLANSLRLTRILEVFPEARFLHIRRDPLFTAQSLLLSRRRHHGSDETWFSIEPPGSGEVCRRPPAYQVVWQAETMRREVSAFLAASGATSLTVEYEQICERPEEVLARVEERFGLTRRAGLHPEPMPPRDCVKLSAPEWTALEQSLADLTADS